jgi:hypothetical protein
MFGAFRVPPSTPPVPTPTPPTSLPTTFGVAMMFYSVARQRKRYLRYNQLEPRMPMHEASSLGPVPVDNPLIADNEKRVLGDVIFTQHIYIYIYICI